MLSKWIGSGWQHWCARERVRCHRSRRGMPTIIARCHTSHRRVVDIPRHLGTPLMLLAGEPSLKRFRGGRTWLLKHCEGRGW